MIGMSNDDLSELSDTEVEQKCKRMENEKKIYEAQQKIAEAKNALNPSEMEKAQTLAEQQKTIAEAQKATLEAKLPTFDVEAPEGTITADKSVNIECHIRAYQAVTQIVSTISDKIKKEYPEINAVVICDEADINNYFSYNIFKRQLLLLKKEYEGLFKSKTEIKAEVEGKDIRALSIDPISGASTLLSSIVDFASLFRTDVDIKGVDVEVVKEALIAELIRSLKHEIDPIYPPFITDIPDKFLTEVSLLKRCKSKADQEIAALSGDASQQDYVKNLKNLNTVYEKIETALASVDEKTGISRLEKLMKGEILGSHLESGTDILYLKVVKAGGNNQTKRRFWQNEMTHSGGAIIAYFLMDAHGKVKESETLNYLFPYQRFEKEGDFYKPKPV